VGPCLVRFTGELSGMKVKRKVLFPYAGDTFGGSHISSLILVRALLSQGVDVTVGLHQQGLLVEYLRSIGVPWIELPKMGGSDRIASEIKRVLAFQRFLRSHDIRVVHTNDRRMHLAWLVPAKLAGVAQVWHQRNPLQSRKVNLQARFATKLICISEYCESSLSSFNKTRSILLANPIEANAKEREVSEARKALTAGAETQNVKIVGFFSNWSARKRPETFVEIAARLRAELGSSVIFAMFGEPREDVRDRVMSRVESFGLKSCFLVMGPRSPIDPWIAACDLVIAPALHEGFGRVLVESMQLGTLVLASAQGGHMEIIRDDYNGFLFPVDDVGLASKKALIALTDTEKSARVVATAKSWALEKFSTQAHLEAMMEVYESL